MNAKRSSGTERVYEAALASARAMSVDYVVPGPSPHEVVIARGTPGQVVLDLRAGLMAHEADWSVGDDYGSDWDDPLTDRLVVEGALKKVAVACVRSSAARHGVTLAGITVARMAKRLLDDVWMRAGEEDDFGWWTDGWNTAHTVCDAALRSAVPEWAFKLADDHSMYLEGHENHRADDGLDVPPIVVLADAVQQQAAYEALYATHPALGILWIPQIRKLVEQRLGVPADPRQYGIQARQALGMSDGAWRGIHRLAEHNEPLLYRMIGAMGVTGHDVMWSLAEAVNRAFARREGWRYVDSAGDGAEAAGAGAATFLWHVWDFYEDAEGGDLIPLGDLGDERYRVDLGEALLAAGEILAAQANSEGRVYGGVEGRGGRLYEHEQTPVLDWLLVEVFEHPSALLRGYREVVKDEMGQERFESLMEWAERRQQRWHRDLPGNRLERPRRQYVWSRHERSVAERTDRVQVPSGIDGEAPTVWTVTEICTSAELEEEGRVMMHCAPMYASQCAAGKSKIYSVRDGEGRRVSTVELKRVVSGEWKLEQHYGMRNAKPSVLAKRVVEAWRRGSWR